MKLEHYIPLLSHLLLIGAAADLPTLYEYYTSDGITSGLSVDQPYFTLNGKNISIYSGAMHYFRIPPQYWRDRLRKLRAAGLNTVETYVAWNIHEPTNGMFEFGDGGTDMEDFADVVEYLKIAQEEDLFAIVRPGPFICAEWEWGGLPSWLLREDGITVRTSHPAYMRYVKRYFDKLIPLLADLQFTNGGPIIAVQVENEYASSPTRDLGYIRQLYDNLKGNGIVELLVTSDGAGNGQSGTIPGLLFQTVNFGSNPNGSFDALKIMQPNKPIMAMEFWTGWFDHWSETHHTVTSDEFRQIYNDILAYPASASMYMFHGGTNWGFHNGANIGPGDNSQFQPTTTSYDYDAPLSEAGDYTEKYDIVKELIQQYNTVQTLTPDQPVLIERQVYDPLPIQEQITYPSLVEQTPFRIVRNTPVPMEELPVNNESGQRYGYIIYSKENLTIAANSVLTITGRIHDSVMVVVNGVLISKPLTSSDDLNGFGYWRLQDSTITLTSTDLVNATLDLFIENWGRGNFGMIYHQNKGLVNNTVYIDDQELTSWSIRPLEFRIFWTSRLDVWEPVDEVVQTAPSLYRTVLTLDEEPTADTYIDMQEWGKGIVIVNGFVLGRYASIGPQQTLYLPAPFLQAGDNEIIVFEQFTPAAEITFSKDAIFKTV